MAETLHEDLDKAVAEGWAAKGNSLFIAGADADLFCAPYIAGGSANGFAQASGLIAGESAAEASMAS